MPLTFSVFLPRTVLACATLALSASALAQVPAPNRFEEDFDDESKPWQEIAVQLPPAPLKENLLPFSVGVNATQSFAIDAKSITVGADEVVRYTLVSTSPAGARNVSYEGIRCQSFELKLYAFGHPNGAWSRSRRDKWEPIAKSVINLQHATLAGEYFCIGKSVAGTAAQMVERIRNQRSLSPHVAN